MAKNAELELVVLKQMYKYFMQDSTLNKAAEGLDEGEGIGVLKIAARLLEDTPHKIKILHGDVVGYGYNFNESYEGKEAKEMYETALENTRAIGGGPNIGELVADGVEGNYGWYLTRISPENSIRRQVMGLD